MSDYIEIVSNLKHNIVQELPGLTAQHRMAPTLREGVRFPSESNANTRQSAVLIAVFQKLGFAHTILIKRTVYNGAHSGQISFPGGKFEEGDTDLTATALREAEEEVGINPKDVEVIGTLTPLYIPVSNMMVLPVVGIIPESYNLKLNLQEVEYTIAPSLMHLHDKANISVKTLCINGKPVSAPYFFAENEIIWGATAMIISELIDLY